MTLDTINMRLNFLLFLGIILVVIGVLIKSIYQLDKTGILVIIIGVICKLIYIISKTRNGTYKPGKEVLILILGLLFFFMGLYNITIGHSYLKPLYLIIIGIILKFIFVYKFIQSINSNKTSTN